MRNFQEQWCALEGRKGGEEPNTPKITKDLQVIRWVEAFKDHLHRFTGAIHIPLVYVIREKEEVDPTCPPLATNEPYSLENGSIELDLVERASHNHGLYKNDNAQVYYKLEEATRGTPYEDSIKPFQTTKDGREGFRSLCGKYAGEDKWELILKKQDYLLHKRKWRGQNSFTLERFFQKHRNAFVMMQSCAQHIEYQLPC